MTLVRLSQSHLNLLSICPPKFQQIYLDCLGTIPNIQQQESMKWGSQFHLLMQQQELTLPIASLLASDRSLDSSFRALIAAVPELAAPESDIWREAEHCRTVSHGKFVLTAIYDLLLAKSDRAIILDWKTYPQPQKANKLAHNWQTRLYLYVLAETSEYTPEQIQMTYWFVGSGKPKNITFQYSQLQHQQTEKDLRELLSHLETWLSDYQLHQHGDCTWSGNPTVPRHQIDFPHRSDCQLKCPYYQSWLKATPPAERHQEWIASIEEIEEISI